MFDDTRNIIRETCNNTFVTDVFVLWREMRAIRPSLPIRKRCIANFYGRKKRGLSLKMKRRWKDFYIERGRKCKCIGILTIHCINT